MQFIRVGQISFLAPNIFDDRARKKWALKTKVYVLSRHN